MFNIQYRFKIYYLTFRPESFHRSKKEVVISACSLGFAISRLISWFETYPDIAKFTYRVSEIHGPIVPGYTVFSKSHNLYKVDPKTLIGDSNE